MNEQEFKHHLKDLVHGHHNPEEHDWAETRKKVAEKKPRTSRARTRKKRS